MAKPTLRLFGGALGALLALLAMHVLAQPVTLPASDALVSNIKVATAAGAATATASPAAAAATPIYTHYPHYANVPNALACAAFSDWTRYTLDKLINRTLSGDPNYAALGPTPLDMPQGTSFSQLELVCEDAVASELYSITLDEYQDEFAWIIIKKDGTYCGAFSRWYRGNAPETPSNLRSANCLSCPSDRGQKDPNDYRAPDASTLCDPSTKYDEPDPYNYCADPLNYAPDDPTNPCYGNDPPPEGPYTGPPTALPTSSTAPRPTATSPVCYEGYAYKRYDGGGGSYGCYEFCGPYDTYGTYQGPYPTGGGGGGGAYPTYYDGGGNYHYKRDEELSRRYDVPHYPCPSKP